MAFKCPFQQDKNCPIENCSLSIPINSSLKHQCAIVTTAYTLIRMEKSIDIIKDLLLRFYEERKTAD
jgi:hypothetical protein